MAPLSSRFAHLITEHLIALLLEELPVELRERTLIGEYVPGLLSQMPFVSVATTVKSTHNAGLGGMVGLKRVMVDGAPVDVGFVTGEAGDCEFTLTLWANSRAEVEKIRLALETIVGVRRVREHEMPVGTLNRTSFLRCRLAHVSAMMVTPLSPAPPAILINADNTDLRTAPDSNAEVIGQANAGQLFELLGRSEDNIFVQGCCFQGRPIWVTATAVTVPAPPIDPSSTPTAWRQHLEYSAYLEVTQEPTVTEGELIQELQITRQLGVGDQILDIERTRLRQDREEVVDEF